MRVSCAVIASALAAHGAEAMEPLVVPSRDDIAYAIYVADRCAALYIALAKQGGEKQLGSATYASLVEGAVVFSSISAMGRAHRQGISLEDAAAQVKRDADNIVPLYVERFNSNYARTGNAVVGEPTLENDFQVCGDVRGMVSE